MKLDPDFSNHCKIARDLDSGRLFARRAASSRSRDLIVATTLLVLFFVSIAKHAPASDEFGDSGSGRRGYIAFVTDVVAVLGLSIGLACLRLYNRPRAHDEEPRRIEGDFFKE